MKLLSAARSDQRLQGAAGLKVTEVRQKVACPDADAINVGWKSDDAAL